MEEIRYLIRILVSLVLGFAIGFERKLRFKEAGIRTHTVVCRGNTNNHCIKIWMCSKNMSLSFILHKE